MPSPVTSSRFASAGLLQLPELAIDPPISHDLIFRHGKNGMFNGAWMDGSGAKIPHNIPRIQDLFNVFRSHLVGGWPTTLKNLTSSVGMMKSPTEWKNKIPVPNHQPVILHRIHDGFWDVWYDSTSGCLAISKKSLDTGTSCPPSCVCWFINPKHTCYVH